MHRLHPKKREHLYWTGTWMCIVHCKVLLVYSEQDSGCTFFPIANVGAGWSSFALWFIAVKSPWLALYVCAVRCISMLVGVPQTTGGEQRTHTHTFKLATGQTIIHVQKYIQPEPVHVIIINIYAEFQRGRTLSYASVQQSDNAAVYSLCVVAVVIVSQYYVKLRKLTS